MLDLLFAPRCPVCERPGPAPCASCVPALVPAPPFPPPPGLDSCRALLVYEGAGRRLVTALKYRNQRACIRAVAEAMHVLATGDGAPPDAADEITWAPTAAARRRRRGYDQAEVLARALARRWGRPCRSLLDRETPVGQTGRSLAARLDGPRFRAVRPPRDRVVVVDDVLTSGATLSAAARALRAAGAREVHALVVARTPPPGTRSVA